MYTAKKVNVSLDQHEKLKNAIANHKAVSIKLVRAGGGGDHTLLLTHLQIARIERAQIIGKSKLMIHLSSKQVKANVQHSGGCLGMLAGLAAKALPVLLGGLTTGRYRKSYWREWTVPTQVWTLCKSGTCKRKWIGFNITLETSWRIR